MSNFSADISKWAGKAEKDFERLRRAGIIELFSSVILDTPVDEGRLRGNWQISSSAPASGVVDILDPQGGKTTANVRQLAAKGKMGEDQVVFLTNNLPYAYAIEYDGASHTKAPEGMVRKNFIRVSQNLKRNLI